MSYLGGLLSILQLVTLSRESDNRLVYTPLRRQPMARDSTSCRMSLSLAGLSTKGAFEVDNPQANNIVEAMLRHPEYIRPLPDGCFKYSFDPVGTPGYNSAPLFRIDYGLTGLADGLGVRRSCYLLHHLPINLQPDIDPVPADDELIGRLHNMVIDITEQTKKTREEASLSRLYLAVVEQHPHDKF